VGLGRGGVVDLVEDIDERDNKEKRRATQERETKTKERFQRKKTSKTN